MAHGVRPWLTLVLALLAALARGTSEHQAREHARRKVEREENLRLADDFRQADTNGDEFLSRGEVVHWELGRQMGYTRAGIQPHAIDAATLQWQADTLLEAADVLDRDGIISREEFFLYSKEESRRERERAAEAEEQIRRRAQAEPGGGPEAAAAAGDDAGSGEPEQHLVVDAFMVHDHDSNGEIAKLELYHYVVSMRGTADRVQSTTEDLLLLHDGDNSGGLSWDEFHGGAQEWMEAHSDPSMDIIPQVEDPSDFESSEDWRTMHGAVT